MKLKVTKEHFDKAVKHSALFVNNCLIAQAFKSAFPGRRVEVNYHYANVGGKAHTFDLPKSLTRLIARFDQLAYAAAGTRTKAEETRLTKLRASLPLTFEVEEAKELN